MKVTNLKETEKRYRVEFIEDDTVEYCNDLEGVKNILFYDGLDDEAVKYMEQVFNEVKNQTEPTFDIEMQVKLEYLPMKDNQYTIRVTKIKD